MNCTGFGRKHFPKNFVVIICLPRLRIEVLCIDPSTHLLSCYASPSRVLPCSRIQSPILFTQMLVMMAFDNDCAGWFTYARGGWGEYSTAVKGRGMPWVLSSPQPWQLFLGHQYIQSLRNDVGDLLDSCAFETCMRVGSRSYPSHTFFGCCQKHKK
jgi:hypothetical protein